MRIAYIYLNKIGKESANMNQTLNMVSSLSKVADVTFYSGWVSGRKLDEVKRHFLIKRNIIIKRIPVSLNTSNLLSEKITRAIYCLCVLALLRLSSKDVLYTRDFGFLYFLSKIPKCLKPGQPIIFEAHTIYHLTSRKVNLAQEKKALLEADKIICISQGIKKDMINLFDFGGEDVLVSPDGYNQENFSGVEADKKERLHKTVIYSGSFKDWKGVEVLVKSLKHVKSRDIRVKLIGGVGPDRKRIEDLVREEGAGQMAEVRGFLPQKEVIGELKSSDIAVIPNTRMTIGERYTSPLKLFEYMACGLPVISSDLPSMREILRERENALFFRAEDERDLASRIDDLAGDPALAGTISANNTRDAQKFTWDKRAENIISFISAYGR